ncbi:MAG: hypothetical protein E7587_05585 [Ruminococcaceae bacterium]|nr:hypothetical protein [Oscillospiraceae bacterium]
MCVIAGYTGSRRAAPILIEMLKKVEYFDGGLATGIATIHEGKLYSVKCLGNVDDLLKNTDAINFPGTCGIIHTRPAGGRASHAHPFVDESGEFAFCENGTYFQVAAPEYKKDAEGILRELYEKGVTFTSAVGAPGDKWDEYHVLLPNGQTIHNAESYAQSIGWAMRDVPSDRLASALAEKTAEMQSRMPSELVTLSVHARLPGVITVGRITRSMSFATQGGETYLCTTPMGFPDDVQKWPITFLPPVTVSQASPQGVTVTSLPIKGVRVEQGGAREEGLVRNHLEKLLADKENPHSLYEMETASLGLWHEPKIDCDIVSPIGQVKETAAVIYRVLWSFFKEGRLRWILGPHGNLTMMKFWLE